MAEVMVAIGWVLIMYVTVPILIVAVIIWLVMRRYR